jgi:hypothetical protein
MAIPQPSPDGAPDYVGLVAGARAWRLANTMWARMGGYLWSWSMLDCWRKGEEWKPAECKQGHRIPGDDCKCGIWAFFDPELLLAEWPGRRAGDEPSELVSGVIGAGGNIVVHELGFRAQYAKVLAVFDDEETIIPLDEIADKHGCSVILRTDFDAFCAEKRLVRLDQD